VRINHGGCLIISGSLCYFIFSCRCICLLIAITS